ncbi:hypothetical protein PPERSA_07298 [Pseudocohnilembus persalinus]|uniref:Uncharacterized protein n=1 Tax=Pseudocohnilembus persalinus TaxID=266149 RepID=A0A0V0QGE5_PSEPJ|nr:hypothetical protein PPERSA_07298 [Pseudocohnilembus persalinus]|eukprot:KRX01259.1 hypothetical protein PPERSA_07298 [Pseudocohnilembus persalinus]
MMNNNFSGRNQILNPQNFYMQNLPNQNQQFPNFNLGVSNLQNFPNIGNIPNIQGQLNAEIFQNFGNQQFPFNNNQLMNNMMNKLAKPQEFFKKINVDANANANADKEKKEKKEKKHKKDKKKKEKKNKQSRSRSRSVSNKKKKEKKKQD